MCIIRESEKMEDTSASTDFIKPELFISTTYTVARGQ